MTLKNIRYILLRCLLASCLISTSSHARTTLKDLNSIESDPVLESLSDFTKKEPYFIENRAHAHFLATRCSALYLSLQIQLRAFSNDKDLKSTLEDIKHKAYIFDKSRRYLGNDPLHDEPSFASQGKYLEFYASHIIKNWKKNNDIFRGIINEDYDVCEDHFLYYEKLTKNLSKEIRYNNSR